MMKRPAGGATKKRPDSETLIDTLSEISHAWGPSGFEHGVRRLLERRVAPFVDHMEVDALGNLICRVGSGGKRIMVAAHMDEIGVMVTFVEKKTGFLRFAPIGGLMHTALLGARVRFEDGTIGTLCMPDYFHAGRQTAPALDEYWIDVSDGGEGRITPGMAACFDREMIQRGSRIIGKAMDDRVGCVVAIEALRRLNKRVQNEVVVVFTVQEEVGLRGARPAAFQVAPDLAIAIDVTSTGDLVNVERNEIRLGAGAAIKLQDTGLIVPPAVRDWMIARAEADGIPYQRETLTLGTTDAAGIQASRAGVASGALSIPTRYVHTTSETVDSADLEACTALLAALLANPVG